MKPAVRSTILVIAALVAVAGCSGQSTIESAAASRATTPTVESVGNDGASTPSADEPEPDVAATADDPDGAADREDAEDASPREAESAPGDRGERMITTDQPGDVDDQDETPVPAAATADEEEAEPSPTPEESSDSEPNDQPAEGEDEEQSPPPPPAGTPAPAAQPASSSDGTVSDQAEAETIEQEPIEQEPIEQEPIDQEPIDQEAIEASVRADLGDASYCEVVDLILVRNANGDGERFIADPDFYEVETRTSLALEKIAAELAPPGIIRWRQIVAESVASRVGFAEEVAAWDIEVVFARRTDWEHPNLREALRELDTLDSALCRPLPGSGQQVPPIDQGPGSPPPIDLGGSVTVELFLDLMGLSDASKQCVGSQISLDQELTQTDEFVSALEQAVVQCSQLILQDLEEP